MSEGIDLNFGGVKAASGFDAIPEDTYLARIEEIEVKDTNDKDGEQQVSSDGRQAQYLNTKYKVMGGDYDGRFLWGINSIRFPVNPLDDTKKERQTREIFLAWLNTVTGTGWEDTEQQLNLKALVGAEVKLVVTQREYQGDVQNNIKKVLPADAETNLDAMRKVI